MQERGLISILLACYVKISFLSSIATGSFPTAQNVTWTSLNFKTSIEWGPPPSEKYSYTVEYSIIGENRERSPYCIRTTQTLCDLTESLNNLKATYSARIVSEPPLGVNTDDVEFPYTNSERFCPYQDTIISKPEFKVEEGADPTSMLLYVTDPPTAIFEGLRQRTIRDIFTDDLSYKVTYWKAQSTGKKTHISESSAITLTGLDRGEAYCFQVQAFLPKRKVGKQLGEVSGIQCSKDKDSSILDVYSSGAIFGGIVLLLVIVAIVIGVTVWCCRRQRNAQQSGKEGVPLSTV